MSYENFGMDNKFGENNAENQNNTENVNTQNVNGCNTAASNEAVLENGAEAVAGCEENEMCKDTFFEEIISSDEPRETQDFSDGTYYTRCTPSGTLADGYEWNASKNTNVNEKSKPQKAKKKSDRGFKIFIGATLSVFTVSAVALALLTASYVFDAKNDNTVSGNNYSQSITPYENFDYSGVTLDNPNFVAFDFDDREGEVLSIPEIAAKCTPSSVGIVSQIETTYNGFFSFAPTTQISEASGSGFIYSADGYIITNHHVIEDAKKVTVILYDNKEFEAEIVGSDSLSDIAVLKITPDEETKLIPMEVGNSDELVVGEGVVAIGCPAGVDFIGTVTDGIVSAINRNVELTESNGTVQKTMTLIQTNATINHGNSGGPLINSRGQVIGINTLKLSSNYEGIGFSIPMKGALPVINQLIEHGKVIERTDEDFAYGKGIIGINGSAISKDEAEYYGIPQGVLVVQINKGSSAAAAGLRRGDIITHYNGTKVETVDDINNLKGSARAGTEVTLTVYRDGENASGETFDITFKLDSQN